MNEFLTDLTTQLRTILTESYQDWAKVGQSLPYVVFKFPSGSPGSTDSVDSNGKILEVDIRTEDSDDIETLTSGIEGLLQAKKFTGVGYYCRLRQEARLSLDEQDNHIRRRQLRYSIDYKKRS